MRDLPPKPARPAPDPVRRRLLRCAAAVACAGVTGVAQGARRADDPRRVPAQPGDYLAFPSWEGDGRAVTPADVAVGAPPVTVYPADPVSGVVRERSRLNPVLLWRDDTDALDEKTRSRALDGLVAYSGVCTHAACGVSEWDAEARHFVCPCHASAFDPRRGAAVVNGPATRALPALPIARDGERFVVAGAFTGRVGAKPE